MPDSVSLTFWHLPCQKEMSKPNMPNKNPAVFSTIFSKGRQHFAGWKTYIFENTTPNTRSFHSAVFPPTVPFLIMQKFPFLPSQKLIWNFTKTILSPQGSHDWFFSLTLFVLAKCHFLKKMCTQWNEPNNRLVLIRSLLPKPGPDSTEHSLLHNTGEVCKRTSISKLAHYHFVEFLILKKKKMHQWTRR